MDILDDMGVSKLSVKVFFFFFKVNYSFNVDRNVKTMFLSGLNMNTQVSCWSVQK